MRYCILSAMTGTAVTFDYSVDGTNFADIKETDGTEVSYTAGDAIRIDPSGWAFAGGGFIRITSGSTEAADRKIKLLFKNCIRRTNVNVWSTYRQNL